MKAENWDLLNGQCFGDDPFNCCDEFEIDIPEFLRFRKRREVVFDIPIEVFCAQAEGRVKRRQHESDKEHRRSVNAAFWMVIGFVLLVFAVNLPEWIL